jgi:hypothetical protein
VSDRSPGRKSRTAKRSRTSGISAFASYSLLLAPYSLSITYNKYNPLAELIFNFTNKNRTKKQQKKVAHIVDF